MLTPVPIPWARIVHFYGRGDDIPAAIELLSSADPSVRASAAKRLREFLEHQDSLMQATPFGVDALIQALIAGSVVERSPVLEILGLVAQAARWQLAALLSASPALTLIDLLHPSRLWPPFVSQDEEEALWEQWRVSEEELSAYHVLTAEVLVAHRALFEGFAAEASEVATSAAALLEEVRALHGQLQERRVTGVA